LAPDPNAPGQKGEEEISLVKARAQKKNGRARGVESGARSWREERARRGGQVLRAATGCASGTEHRTRGSARARGRARARNCKLYSARLIHPKYCSDHGGIFRRMVLGLVAGPGLKDSTFFFPPGLVLFQGVPVGGERYAARAGLLEPRPGVQQPPTSGVNGVYLCPACARQVGRALHAPTLSSWRPKVAQTYDVKRYALSGGPSSSLPVQRKPHHAPYKRLLCMPRVRQRAWNGSACPGAHQAEVPKQREKCDVKRYP